MTEPAAPEVPDAVGVYEDADGRVHSASRTSPATVENVATGAWTPLEQQPPGGPFDPTKAAVRDVVAHLATHAGDPAEIARVKDAEAAGRSRPTIADWTPAAP